MYTFKIILGIIILLPVSFIFALGVRTLLKLRTEWLARREADAERARQHRVASFKNTVRSVVYKHLQMLNALADRDVIVDDDQPLSHFFGIKSANQQIRLRDWVYEPLCNAIAQEVMFRYNAPSRWYSPFETLSFLMLLEDRMRVENTPGMTIFQVSDLVKNLVNDLAPYVPGLTQGEE